MDKVAQLPLCSLFIPLELVIWVKSKFPEPILFLLLCAYSKKSKEEYGSFRN